MRGRPIARWRTNAEAPLTSSAVATHYELLGVPPSATFDEVRQAYLARARELHPDASGGSSKAAMQAVNEAWRVLRTPESRAQYDASLVAVGGPSPAEEDEWVDPLDRPYRHAVAEPGDLTVTIARAVPWIAVVIVLLVIFVFTAYAGSGDDAPEECVNPGAGIPGTPCPENP